MNKGKLIRVELSPGRFVKMHEGDAIERGLVKPKARPAAENKLRLAGEDKAGERKAPVGSVERRAESAEREETLQAADDFTTIAGVGPASSRALAARGITTFEQLRKAPSLFFLTSKAQEAIEIWKTLP